MLDLDEELRDAGARWRAGQRDPIVDVERATTRYRSRRIKIAAACVCVALVAVVATASAVGHDRTHRVVVAPTPHRSGPDQILLNREILEPSVLAVDGDRLWVSGYASSGNVHRAPAHLQEIDTKTGKLVGDVTLPDDSPYEIRVAGDVVWVAAQQADESTELLKIDAASMTILARIPGTISSQFTVTPDAVWGLDGAGSLRRIDPLTAQVVASIPLRVFGIYADGFVVSGPLGVFVGNGSSGRVQKIDEATNTAGPEIDVAPQLSGMVELGDSLWVRDGDRVVELAHGTTPGARVPLGERAFDIATDGVSLWLGADGAHVLRFDPVTRSVTSVALPPGTHGRTLAADPKTGAVWAMSQEPTPRLLRVPTG